MSNVKKAVKSLIKSNILFIIIEVLTVVFCFASIGMFSAGEDIFDGLSDGLMVSEAMKALLLGLGIALFTEIFFCNAKALLVLPIKRVDAVKIFYDKLLFAAAVPMFAEILFYLLLLTDVDPLRTGTVFSSAAKPLTLMMISAAFTVSFTICSLIYAEIRNMEISPLAKCWKYGGYWMVTVILYIIKGHCMGAAAEADKGEWAIFAAYAVLAAAAVVIYFAVVRKKLAETFIF